MNKISLSLLSICMLAITHGAYAMGNQKNQSFQQVYSDVRDRIHRIDQKIAQDKSLPSKFVYSKKISPEYTSDIMRPCINLTNAVLKNAIRPSGAGFFNRLAWFLGLKPHLVYAYPFAKEVTQPESTGIAIAELLEHNNDGKQVYTYFMDKNKESDVEVYSEIKICGEESAQKFDAVKNELPRIMFAEQPYSPNPGKSDINGIAIAMVDSYTKCVGVRYKESKSDNFLTNSAEGDSKSRKYWCKTVMPYQTFVQYVEAMRNK